MLRNKDEGHDGHVIIKYNQLQHRLKPFGLHIADWGKLAVCLDSDPHSGYILNNVTDIKVIEGFVAGLEYSKKIGG